MVITIPSRVDDSNWLLESHTKEKHRILDYYLTIWKGILQANYRTLVFWDCFAGRGEYSNREPGSPLIAMKHSQELFEASERRGRPVSMKCIFIERDSGCHAYLRDILRDAYPDEEGVRWYLFRGDCVSEYESLMASGEELYRRQYPNFSFIDPYGPNIPLSTIRQMNGPKKEVLITLMTEWVNRFASDGRQENILKAMFGVDNLTYLRSICGQENSFPQIVSYYKSRLRAYDGAAIRYLTTEYEMRPDRRDIPLYYLIGGSNHSTGVQKMHESMRAISENEELAYRGRQQGQTTLAFLEDRIGNIAQWLYDNITFNLGNLESIYLVCCQQQAWSRTDVIEAVLRLEDEGKVRVEEAGGRRRRGRTLGRHHIHFIR